MPKSKKKPLSSLIPVTYRDSRSGLTGGAIIVCSKCGRNFYFSLSRLSELPGADPA
jgi:hypothetical protein